MPAFICPTRLCARKNLSTPGLVLILTLLAVLAPGGAALGQPIQHVIHISVDGLRPDAVTTLGAGEVPNFYRLRNEGAFTDNARADYWVTETLPNHVTQLTSRPIKDPNQVTYGLTGAAYAGHDYTGNSDPDPATTLATNKGAYVAGVFEVAHAAGLRTGLYASKTRFKLFTQSWPGMIDASRLTQYDSRTILTHMEEDMASQVQGYTFLHVNDLDYAGHYQGGWMNANYMAALRTIDSYLGEIFDMIQGNDSLRGATAIVLTADHAGLGGTHVDPTIPEDYTIPFYVWGPGVAAAADLYGLNATDRLDPGIARPTYYAPIQPIRNGEAGNLALELLGLGYIPGSTLNAAQDLIPYHPGDATKDGYVNVDDLGVLASNYEGSGRLWGQADFTRDGIVNVDDLGILASNYGWVGPGGLIVPEPATLSLLVLGGLAVLRRRRAVR